MLIITSQLYQKITQRNKKTDIGIPINDVRK